MPRRFPIAVLVVSAVFFVLTTSLAAAAPPPRILINGQEVVSDVAPAIIEDRTMVPVRVISEYLGARVDWNPSERSVTVNMAGDVLVLFIGKKTAYFNDAERKLDVAARIIGGRAMVPLRFIGEALGAQVAWDGGTRTVRVTKESQQVTGVSYEHGRQRARITIAATGAIPFEAKTLDRSGESPDRLILDLIFATLATPQEVYQVNQGNVTQVSLGMIRTNPNIARVVVDLTEPVRFTVSRSPSKDKIYIDLEHQVTGIRFQTSPAGQMVHIDTSGPVDYEVHELSGPDRVVVDILDATLGRGVAPALPVSSPPLRQVRAAQFQVNPDKARVVVDLERRSNYQITSTDRGLVIQFGSQVSDLAWQRLPGKAVVSYRLPYPVPYTVEHLENPHRLVIELANTTFGSAVPYEVNNGVIDRITMENGQRPDGTPVGRVILHLPYYLGHTLTGSEPGAVTVELVASVLHQKTIVVDPGHGGSDPGAIGPSGVREKRVTMEVAAILKRLLEEAGARVILTRTGDEDVPLYDRAEIANEQQADLFISIHANSFYTSSKNGAETYYYTTNPLSADLARAVHQAFVAGIGLADRGVRSANFVVIREPVMPSVLLEMAFLSNPAEEKLLADPAFQQKAAQAILAGLTRFFESQPR